MCGVHRVYCHLPERVLRQYRYVQTVPRHPTDVVELRPPQILCRHSLTSTPARLRSPIGVSRQESRHGV